MSAVIRVPFSGRTRGHAGGSPAGRNHHRTLAGRLSGRSLATCLAALAAVASGQQYDHLTIVPDSLATALAPVCARVESRGLADTTVTVADVLASSSGRDDQEKVRNFIKRAYADWGVTDVLLAGDNEQIPCRLCYVEINGQYHDWIPTEIYYSALDGDWDGDGDGRFGEPEDSVDLIPDVLLGRLPLVTPAEMQAFAARYLAYTGDSTRPYLENVLYAGFDISDQYREEDICEVLDSLFRPPAMRAFKVYDSHSGNHKDSVRQLLDRGMHVWLQYDHCTYNILGSGWLRHNWYLPATELNNMANAPDYSIGICAGCLPSAFDSSYCVAEVLLAAPNGGCVAFFGSTRLTWGTDPDPLRTGSHYYCEKVLEGLWAGPGPGSFAGLVAGQASAAPLVPSNVVWRWCHYEFMLSGEPSMPVWVPANVGTGEAPESRAGRETGGATIVRGVLFVGAGPGPDPEPPGRPGSWHAPSLFDAAGRAVMGLRPGANDLRQLAPGVYYVVTGSNSANVRKVVKAGKD